MKDMTVKELIVKCGVGWNDFKAELLRRVEALEKRLNTVCQVKATDKVGFDFEILDKIDKLEKENESLQCCGNCGTKYDHCFWKHSWKYCPHWQTDGLTRAEREGK